MSVVKPDEVLSKVAGAVPEKYLENIVIIGSLAAAYAYFHDEKTVSMRTKDVDCILRPYLEAKETAQSITKKLLDAGWHRRKKGNFINPGKESTPEGELPAIRLYPPNVKAEDENAWFVELMTEPESVSDKGQKWTRIIIDEDHFGLPSFQFFSITVFKPKKITEYGIYYARPQMMALANLLEHPEIKPDRMSSTFAGLEIKRSNKDLGRVLAIGYLEQEKGMTDFKEWFEIWALALKITFPDAWKEFAKNAGSGLRELLNSDEDLKEAHITCVNGLLSSFPVTLGELKEVGERILIEAVERLEEYADKQ